MFRAEAKSGNETPPDELQNVALVRAIQSASWGGHEKHKSGEGWGGGQGQTRLSESIIFIQLQRRPDLGAQGSPEAIDTTNDPTRSKF